MNRLPVELLSRILSYHFDAFPDFDDNNIHLAPTQVSCLWREVSISRPSFWSKLAFNISIDRGTITPQGDAGDLTLIRTTTLEMIRLYFARVRNHQIELSIALRGGEGDFSESLMDLKMLILEKAPSFRAFAEIGSSYFSSDVLARLDPLIVTQLRLDIIPEDMSGTYAFPALHTLVLGDDISRDELAVILSPRLRSLIFCCRFHEINEEEPRELMSALQNYPKLEEFIANVDVIFKGSGLLRHEGIKQLGLHAQDFTPRHVKDPKHLLAFIDCFPNMNCITFMDFQLVCDLEDLPSSESLQVVERIEELRFQGDELVFAPTVALAFSLFSHANRICLGQLEDTSPFEISTYSSLAGSAWFLKLLLEVDQFGTPIRWPILQYLGLYRHEMTTEEIRVLLLVMDIRGRSVENLGDFVHGLPTCPLVLTMKGCTQKFSYNFNDVYDIPSFESYSWKQVKRVIRQLEEKRFKMRTL